MDKKIINPIIAAFLAAFATCGIKAQETIDRTVQVIRPYEPTLTTAPKINLMPRTEDTVRIRPNIRYTLISKKLTYNFEPRPLTAAKLVGVPFPKLYKSYLRMGIGNHATPLGEFYFNSLQAKEYNYGFYLQHYSSSDKVKLANDQKIYAGAARNRIELFGNYFFETVKLSADAGYLRQGHHQYGYNTDLVDTIFNDRKTKQVYSGVYGGLRLQSLSTDTADIHYYSGLNYQYFFDKYTSYEHGIKFDAGFDKIINSNTFGLDFFYHHYSYSSTVDSGGFNSLIRISPYMTKLGKDWKFLIGASMFIDSDEFDPEVTLHPRGEFQFNIVEKVLVPYLGVDGYVEQNTYSKIALENPFIRPDNRVANSVHKFNGYAGMKGNYSDHLSFDLRAAYGLIDDMYFYFNDSVSEDNNYMDVVYDDIELSQITASLSYKSKAFRMAGRFDLYGYKLINLPKPWHRPDYTFVLETGYTFKEKIDVELGMNLTGNRYAPVFDDPNRDMIKLAAVADFHIGTEYHYSKVLTGFIRFSNISTSKYYLYHQYPGFGFQFLAGFTYSL